MTSVKRISERVLEWERRQKELEAQKQAIQAKGSPNERVVVGRQAFRSSTAPPKPQQPVRSKEEIEQEKAIMKIQAAYRMSFQRKTFKLILKSHRYRTQVVEEILTTESQYVKQLQLIVKNFVHPLRASAATPEPILSNEEIRTIFSTIEIIVATNMELLEELQKRMNSWHANQVIGDIFVKMAAFMKVYTNYVKNFNAALSCIQNCKTNIRFVEFCENAFKFMESDIVDLPSFLISPVQRIPRYQLLLQDLLKHTWESHADYVNLSNALGEITTTALYVNEKQKEAENIQKVLSIQATLIGKKLKSLVDPHRRFVREGGLMEVNSKGKMVARWFILFNDILVKCKPPSNSIMKRSKTKHNTLEAALKFEYLEQYPLGSADVVNLGDEDQKKHGFEIITSETSLWLCAPTEEEKEGWVKDLNHEIASLKKKNEFYEEQHTKIASQRAAAARALIEEQYAGYRVHGANKYDSLLRENPAEKKEGDSTPFDSLAQRLELQRKAEERMKLLLEEEQAMIASAQERVDDFKNSITRRYSTTPDGVDPSASPVDGRRAVSQQLSPQEVKEYEQSNGGGRRKFASMKREDYRSAAGHLSQNVSDTPPPKGPKTGNFNMTPDKCATIDLGDVGKRKFASMKREDYRSRRTSVSNESDVQGETQTAAPPAATSSPAPSPTPNPAGKRAFASLPRTDYRRLSNTIENAPSPAKPATEEKKNTTDQQPTAEAPKEGAGSGIKEEEAPTDNGTITEHAEGEEAVVGRRRFSSIQRVDYRGRTGSRASTVVPTSSNAEGTNEESKKEKKNKKKKKRNTLTKKKAKEPEKKEPKKGNFALSPDKAATLDLGEVPRKRLADDLLKQEEAKKSAPTPTAQPSTNSSAGTSEESGGAPKRRFASMKREDYRQSNPPPATPSGGGGSGISAATPAAATTTTTPQPAEGGAGGEQPKLRRFAAMKREHFKTLGADAPVTNDSTPPPATTNGKGGEKKASTLTKAPRKD